MQQHLIVVDLDGTALKNHTELAPFTLTVLKQLQANGHIIMIATGRSYLASRKFYEQLGSATPLSNLNGAIVHHPSCANFPPLQHFVNASLLEKLFDISCFPEVEIIWIDKQLQAVMTGTNAQIDQLIAEQNFIADISIQSLSPADLATAHACTVVIKNGMVSQFMEKAEEIFGKNVALRCWGPGYENFIELFTPHISKASAIAHVQAHYGINNAHTLAFGDQMNDLEMFAYVPHSVAMSNAVPELKALAHAITDRPNTAGGVGHYLNQYFQLNITE
ncbi:MAG: Cof-type HAD-IIB family hydrolase [Culicoidibacterales bacterium]